MAAADCAKALVHIQETETEKKLCSKEGGANPGGKRRPRLSEMGFHPEVEPEEVEFFCHLEK